jgi:hypothetical protein
MIASAMEQQERLQKALWVFILGIGALAMSYLLASDQVMLVLCIGVLGWMMTLPYHAKLSIRVSIATFSSALILPLFPGRPYLWEFAALLGWTGTLISLMLRQYPEDVGARFRANRLLFVGMFGYAAVLVVTMYARGVGLNILGSGQVGGRFYFQQLACSIFPILFLMNRIEESTLVRLFVVQLLLTTTYVVSDFIFSIAPAGLFFLLQFFEIPGDAMGFEYQAGRFGVRRFQSLYVVGSGLFFLLMVRYNLRDFFSFRSIVLIPAAAGVMAMGAFSGHRYLLVIVPFVVLVCAYAQRFFNWRNILVGGMVIATVLSFVYPFADRTPLAFQRVVSVLPGIDIDPQARMDGDSSMDARRQLRKIGFEMMPQYFWIGRGFGLEMNDTSWQWDPTTITMHANQGRFFNGFIGLMVNTGFFGTLFMGIFLVGGVMLSWRILSHLRTHGCEDNFSRVCGIATGWWLANAFGFLVLHGDSEYAMKTFALQIATMLACERSLDARLRRASEGE